MLATGVAATASLSALQGGPPDCDPAMQRGLEPTLVKAAGARTKLATISMIAVGLVGAPTGLTGT